MVHKRKINKLFNNQSLKTFSHTMVPSKGRNSTYFSRNHFLWDFVLNLLNVWKYNYHCIKITSVSVQCG